MTKAIFANYFRVFNTKMELTRRKVLVLLNNASVHDNKLRYSSIEFLYLPPNTTTHLQPLDAGIIASFKKQYRKLQYTAVAVKYRIAVMNDKLSDKINWTLRDRYNLSLPADRRSNKKKNFFHLDQLQGMQDIKRACRSVSSETISNRYLHTGLFESLNNSSEVRKVAK
ncbi:hypothetical protein A0J61_10651 [Choanephora cucurbitarum]|uniref:DDE-1 domain-containing protein n=1 Tax=Choanephora cucurbitarum TaxID=101091 RepID=A0A1C7MWX0_9FUNG|nr:hypothetical protein A0J61_10651 [Choanephora cucurbitarum]